MVDEALHPPLFPQDLLSGSRPVAEARTIQRDLELGGGVRERASQFVRCVGDELALTLDRGLEPVEHPVHRDGEAFDLIVGRGLGHATIEVGRRDRVDLGSDRFDGPISEYIRSETYGPARIVEFYDLWYRNRRVPRELLLIRYEELHAEPEKVLRHVLAFIGAEGVDGGAVREAVEFARFENMRAMEAANALGDGRLRAFDPTDQESYKTRKGVVGGYVEYLSDDDAQLIDRMVAAAGCPFLDVGLERSPARLS